MRLIKAAGSGALMAKLYLKAAYRHVPVHPNNQSLLAIRWGSTTYLDTALLFSAPKLFTAMADGLAWCMVCEGISHSSTTWMISSFAPLVKFGTVGNLCRWLLNCQELGFPVAPDKVVGPSTILTFLGIELNSVSMVMRPTKPKLERLKASLNRWLGRSSARKRQLQSIIGQLSDAAIVVWPGRTFLQSLIKTAKIPKKQEHLVRLNGKCRADLHWWDTFLEGWNGVALFPDRPAGDKITSDASGSWGCGAFLEGGTVWFQFQWPMGWEGVNIATKELFPIVWQLPSGVRNGG